MWATAGRRSGGRWVGWAKGTLQNSVKSRAESEAERVAGLILDHLGRAALEQVRDGERSLNDAYVEAQEARDVTLRKVEAERIAAEAEAKAERFIRDSAPDMAEQVGTTYETRP